MPPQFPAHSPCVVLHYTYAVLAPFADETSDKIMLLYCFTLLVLLLLTRSASFLQARTHTYCIMLYFLHTIIVHYARRQQNIT